MGERRSFDDGMLAGLLFALAGWAGNWLITPMRHPDAGPLRVALVVGQAVVCVSVAVWLVLHRRPRAGVPPAV